MAEISQERHSVFFRRKGIKVSIRYSWANLKDISEDFQRYELPPSLVRFLCQTFQHFRRHAFHTELIDQEVKSFSRQRFSKDVSQLSRLLQPPPPASQTPTQQTPHTVSTIKLLILKKGEYDIWAIKMEHYLAHTDYPIWEVIQNGNGPISITTDTQGQIKVLPPRTVEEILARERERKARTTLLMALLEDHLAKFHKMTDAKEMWEAIKSRFGGNNESKKMQKYILKQQFKGFSVSNSEGLHKGYDRFQSLLSQLEIHGVGVNSLSFDDLYNNLRVFENDVKGSTTSPSNTQNVAFVSENTISTNDLDEFDLEEIDLKWQVAMISIRMKITKGNQDSKRRDAWNSGNKDGRRSSKQEDSKALVTIDGEGVDWTSHSEEEEDYVLMACNSSDTEVTSCSNEYKESYAKLKKLYDEQRAQLSDASIEIQAYTQGLKKVEAQLVAHQQGQLWYEEKIRFMKIDLDDKTDVLTYHKKLLAEAQKEKEDLKAKVEKWHNSSKNLGKLLNTQMSANDKFGLGYGDHRYDGILSYENEVLQSVFMNKESELEKQPLYDRFVTAGGMHAVPPPMTGNYMPSGPDVEIDYSQFTYGPKQSQPSESETQTSDFDTCESDSSEPTVNEPKVVSQPKVWSDAPIIEEYASDSEDEHVSLPTEEQETPSFANQQVKTPRETVKNQFTNSKNPKVDKKGLGYGFVTKACFVCGSLSHLIRDCDFHEKRMAKQAELNNKLRKKSSQREIRPIWNNVQRVNHQNQFVPTAILTRTGKILVSTARAVPTNAAMKVNTIKPIVNRVDTAEENAVSDVGGKREIAVKPSADSSPNRIGSLRESNLFSVSQICDKKNKVLFTDSECLVLSSEFKLPNANQVLLKIPKQNNMYSFNLENIVPSGGLACLIAKATIDESNKWHRRLGYVNC
ncbi:hypothetical protein Tco_0707907 [Tanacetum coccineum]